MGVVPAMLAERLGLPQVTFASELTVDGQQRDDPPRRRRRLGDHRGVAARARLGHRPDQRAALPLLQGDHGREEEAGRAVGPGRPRRRRPRRSASTPPGPRSSRSPSARRASRARSSPTRATAAPSSPSSSPRRSSSEPGSRRRRNTPWLKYSSSSTTPTARLRKTTAELLTIARRLGEPVRRLRRLRLREGPGHAGQVRRPEGLRVDDADVRRLPRRAAGRDARPARREGRPRRGAHPEQRRRQGDRRAPGDQDRVGPDHRRRRRPGR